MSVYSVFAMPVNDVPIEEHQCILEALSPQLVRHPPWQQTAVFATDHLLHIIVFICIRISIASVF